MSKLLNNDRYAELRVEECEKQITSSKIMFVDFSQPFSEPSLAAGHVLKDVFTHADAVQPGCRGI